MLLNFVVLFWFLLILVTDVFSLAQAEANQAWMEHGIISVTHFNFSAETISRGGSKFMLNS